MPPAPRTGTGPLRRVTAGAGGAAGRATAARSAGGISVTGRPPTHRYGWPVPGWIEGGATTYPPSP